MSYRDYRGRIVVIPRAEQDIEHYIHPYDGRLKPLCVQVKDERLLKETDRVSWKRTKIATPGSWLDRILHWIWSSVDTGQARSALFGSYGGLEVALKWIPSCILLFLLFFIPQQVGGEIQNNGDYEPIREKDRYYAKVSRNRAEDDPESAVRNLLRREPSPGNAGEVELSYIPNQPSLNDVVNGDLSYETDHDRYLGLMFRPLRPQTLCFLVPNEHPEYPYESYQKRRGDDNDTPYVFVSYTRKAFPVEPKNKGDPEEERIATKAKEELLRFAVAAARRANVEAFWIDFEGVEQPKNSKTTDSVSEDVYRICDVLRGAASMVVVNGSLWELKGEDPAEGNDKTWLQIWAHRLWVLTELLLAPMERNILVFTRQAFTSPEATCPQEYTKRNLALIACKDALEVRQLIEHYEGNPLLTPLELVQMALACLRRRQNNTVDRTGADLAYALKGLLRRRPRTVEKESGFEAFASLSLANDSQKLLERLICTLPPDPNAGWSDMRDGWGAQLWDIEPSCQIAGIVNERTVLLDGAHAASIRWSRLEKVAFVTKNTPFRLFAKFVVRGIPAWLICSALFIMSCIQLLQPAELENGEGLTQEDADNCRGDVTCQTKTFLKRLGDSFHVWATNFSIPFVVFGSIWCLLSLAIVVSSPYLLYRLYHGKFWDTQAWFFGIEGDVEDLADIERRLFGVCKNRLTWSANGSLLSQHCRDPKFDERIAIQPLKQNRKDAVPRHIRHHSQCGSDTTSSTTNVESRERLFTLIDTYTLTVTQFFAERPPTAVFLCGQEGGMQRAVLCSYDWKRRTWCRESVLRMKTLVLDKMPRVDRFQFALKREDKLSQ